jgi:hypothetical protein
MPSAWKRTERAETVAALRQAARSPELWMVVGYVFYLIFTPGTNMAKFYYSVDTLHFSKQFIGNLGQFTSAGVLLGILFFAAVSRKLPVAAVTCLTVPAALLILLLPAWAKSRQPLSAQPETI